MAGISEIGPIRLNVPIKNNEGSVAAKNQVSFEETFKEFISGVNENQIRSEDMTGAFARGEVRDLHEVIIAQQEAAVSLKLLVQMRDRVISAYQEISRMQV
ncbi:MAG: flagellar hook-basal body complex protein FliE [Candidatus Eisenbacteria bacterium]|uniref:Flagellar hook-basal body complex protein FliE n=1 Tax=Eiseniibacteriota bacterium TaxID=2212470 RepID=A0A948W801_UNCEI|nr:flagellar hook-basal body complex protein FliE [Candidatus Eisenbacteria bacterium]MBU1950941.1 flagellar hook-basal body complex protein FliE [Candidatus Eisenbacteria bacterium]MBU2692186.1 flagellar hook-basal body complex protein FliE [Candidatus Eisenbacteria bacterium]